MPAPSSHTFRGKLAAEGQRLVLDAGGVRVDVIPADRQSAAVVRDLAGAMITLNGVQEGSRILHAQLPIVAESAEEPGADPELVELLRLAENPPAMLRAAMTPVRDRIVALRPRVPDRRGAGRSRARSPDEARRRCGGVDPPRDNRGRSS